MLKQLKEPKGPVISQSGLILEHIFPRLHHLIHFFTPTSPSLFLLLSPSLSLPLSLTHTRTDTSSLRLKSAAWGTILSPFINRLHSCFTNSSRNATHLDSVVFRMGGEEVVWGEGWANKNSFALLALILSIFLWPLFIFPSIPACAQCWSHSVSFFFWADVTVREHQSAMNSSTAAFKASTFQSYLVASHSKLMSSHVAISQLWKPPIVSVPIQAMRHLWCHKGCLYLTESAPGWVTITP